MRKHIKACILNNGIKSIQKHQPGSIQKALLKQEIMCGPVRSGRRYQVIFKESGRSAKDEPHKNEKNNHQAYVEPERFFFDKLRYQPEIEQEKGKVKNGIANEF